MKGYISNFLLLFSLPSFAYASGEIATSSKLALLFFLLAACASVLLIIYGAIKHKKALSKYKVISVIVGFILLLSYSVLNMMDFSTTLFIHTIVAMLCLAQIALYVKINNA